MDFRASVERKGRPDVGLLEADLIRPRIDVPVCLGRNTGLYTRDKADRASTLGKACCRRLPRPGNQRVMGPTPNPCSTPSSTRTRARRHRMARWSVHDTPLSMDERPNSPSDRPDSASAGRRGDERSNLYHKPFVRTSGNPSTAQPRHRDKARKATQAYSGPCRRGHPFWPTWKARIVIELLRKKIRNASAKCCRRTTRMATDRSSGTDGREADVARRDRRESIDLDAEHCERTLALLPGAVSRGASCPPSTRSNRILRPPRVIRTGTNNHHSFACPRKRSPQWPRSRHHARATARARACRPPQAAAAIVPRSGLQRQTSHAHTRQPHTIQPILQRDGDLAAFGRRLWKRPRRTPKPKTNRNIHTRPCGRPLRACVLARASTPP